jgi:hypothetical protein
MRPGASSQRLRIVSAGPGHLASRKSCERPLRRDIHAAVSGWNGSQPAETQSDFPERSPESGRTAFGQTTSFKRHNRT